VPLSIPPRSPLGLGPAVEEIGAINLASQVGLVGAPEQREPGARCTPGRGIAEGRCWSPFGPRGIGNRGTVAVSLGPLECGAEQGGWALAQLVAMPDLPLTRKRSEVQILVRPQMKPQVTRHLSLPGH
jgi:hypothetical protein